MYRVLLTFLLSVLWISSVLADVPLDDNRMIDIIQENANFPMFLIIVFIAIIILVIISILKKRRKNKKD